ncbi:heavy metal-binding domain-containing protein [Lacihabitans sp. CCS-44]|uniref:heavy metal-binding domain-containing protein n=1 Tax=Lacihabitans sp. CCS-44 TaxID=2487331 RepID=UPI0020CC3E83|nr:heavy metal-binding domain-containing protein [Lacihabitans sp. CCS-44]
MKNLIIVALILVLGSCNSAKNESTKVTQSYSCPMHPEIIGKEGEKCSDCGMDLTEPVTQNPDSTSVKK